MKTFDLYCLFREGIWLRGVLVGEPTVESLTKDDCSSLLAFFRGLAPGDPKFGVLTADNTTYILLHFKLVKDRFLGFAL